MAALATHSNPLRVAIIGSGPSGFYAAEALLRRAHIVVDMFDRLPTPFGLVRGGVAPDHPKIKQVCLVYDRIARSPGFSFLGNVTVGAEVTIEQLRAAYHAVVIACGASTDRRLGIPGEGLPGSHTATEFVGWYNGHPDYQDCRFDFAHDTAVIVGQGNVAADVARILATPVECLRTTDICESAVEVLAGSRVRDIHIIGRRGPAQAKFTSVELRELGKVPDCVALCDPDDLRLNATSLNELADPRADENKKNVEIFRTFGANAGTPTPAIRRLHFHFLQSPTRINGSSCVTSVTLVGNELSGPKFEQVAIPGSDCFSLPCGLVFRSVGYQGVRLPGVAFDERGGIIPNAKGRCLDGNKAIPGLYVTGWIKRGPSGLIGTNRADSVETVASIFEDILSLEPGPKPGANALRDALGRSPRIVSYKDWQTIDLSERQRGQQRGKPREKFTRVADMIEALDRLLQRESIASDS
ncbi:MAG TPA: FAD-dependent oxidoreductase [Xanthobacteraceae bacterium]